jgi:transposase-like protein
MISFKWRRFPKDIILMSVRWKLAYALSYRDIEEMMEERGICVERKHSTINYMTPKEFEFKMDSEKLNCPKLAG